MALTRQEKADAREIFAAGNACGDCGGIHQRACPRIKRVDLHPNGNRVGVTYFKRFDNTGIVWPEDAYDPDDSDEGAANGR